MKKIVNIAKIILLLTVFVTMNRMIVANAAEAEPELVEDELLVCPDNPEFDRDSEEWEKLKPYQEILDRLNEEYGTHVYFAADMFNPELGYIIPYTISPEEFEAIIRSDIELCIDVEKESKEKIEALGDVEWKEAPASEKVYKMPAGATYLNSGLPGSFAAKSLEANKNTQSEQNSGEEFERKVVENFRIKQDTSGNILIMIIGGCQILLLVISKMNKK